MEHVPTGVERTITISRNIHVNAAKKMKLKAQRNGYKYVRDKREYMKHDGEYIYHLIFA